MNPPDQLLGLNQAFQKSSNPNKVNLSIGAYKDNEGKPFLLPSVVSAQKEIIKELNNFE